MATATLSRHLRAELLVLCQPGDVQSPRFEPEVFGVGRVRDFVNVDRRCESEGRNEHIQRAEARGHPSASAEQVDYVDRPVRRSMRAVPELTEMTGGVPRKYARSSAELKRRGVTPSPLINQAFGRLSNIRAENCHAFGPTATRTHVCRFASHLRTLRNGAGASHTAWRFVTIDRHPLSPINGRCKNQHVSSPRTSAPDREGVQ